MGLVDFVWNMLLVIHSRLRVLEVLELVMQKFHFAPGGCGFVQHVLCGIHVFSRLQGGSSENLGAFIPHHGRVVYSSCEVYCMKEKTSHWLAVTSIFAS